MTDLAIVIIVMILAASFCFAWATYYIGRAWLDDNSFIGRIRADKAETEDIEAYWRKHLEDIGRG